MAAAKLLLLSILASLLILGVRCDAGAGEEIAEPKPADDSLLSLELEQLKSKISSLESSLSDRVRESTIKDESISRLEKIMQEKSSSIALLQGEIDALQKRGAVIENELAGKAQARSRELEKQIGKLRAEIDSQSRKRDALEIKAGAAEKKLQELNVRLEKLQKTNNEQKDTIRKTERALKVAEEELMRAQLEATSKAKELMEVHGSWIPPWLETHITYFLDLATAEWIEHGKPILAASLQKASEVSAQAQIFIEPHLETAKTKLVPAVKEQWIIFRTNIEPHVQVVCTKSIEFYEVSKSTVAPHIVRVQELADPYFQEAKKFSKPYIVQVAVASKPHVEKARVALKPYTKLVVRKYQDLLKSTAIYHHQIQGIVMEHLKKWELTKSLATKELVWFLASALLVFPALCLYKFLFATFCKKARKPTRKAHHHHHATRKHKRRHTDK